MAKLPRKHQKVFASNAANNGQFGSAQLGTKLLTNDLDTIQALTAFVNGWNDATISGQKLLTLEELQALQYLQTSQLAYLFQEGIAEFDISLATEYHQYSIVKKPGSYELYGSKIDNNIGNALPGTSGDANWDFLGDLSGLSQGSSPIGSEVYTMLSTAPSGWLFEEGQEISRVTYANLWNWANSNGLVNTEANWQAGEYGLFSDGNGSTTFRLPDMRGQFIRVQDNGAGIDPDSGARAGADTVGSVQSFALENMTGSFSFVDNDNSQITAKVRGASGVYTSSNISGTTNGSWSSSGINSNDQIDFNASNVAQTSTETRPRNIYRKLMIRY
jgi:microcystin-dependent protein